MLLKSKCNKGNRLCERDNLQEGWAISELQIMCDFFFVTPLYNDKLLTIIVANIII
jgi:hypothetical protein